MRPPIERGHRDRVILPASAAGLSKHDILDLWRRDRYSRLESEALHPRYMDTATTREISATTAAAVRLRTARRIFLGALIFNSALTVFWLFAFLTKGTGGFFQQYTITREV